MPNLYHPRMAAAITAAKLRLEDFPDLQPIPYGMVLRAARNGKFITITRFKSGMYETAICYDTKMDDFCQIVHPR